MIKKFWPQTVLFLLVLVLFLSNYLPGTWLSGWDNLHPEFDFGINIKRSIFAVWQEYQGLGLLGGMGHASDLFRQIFLWIISFILPTNFNRYFFHFLMLFIGPLGVYFLLKNIILKKSASNKEIFSLSGAVFYLFNLVTLQMFYVPFEAYSSHYGFLPWLFYSQLSYFQKNDKRNMIFLIAINLLAISQAYIGTFFLVYFIAFSLISVSYLLSNRNHIRRVLISYVLIFCINAFWLLPNIYFVFNKVEVNTQAKINQMVTQDILLRNKKYGNIADTALLRGFWFDNVEMDKEGINRYQFEEWKKHMDNPAFSVIGYWLFTVCVLGIFYCLKRRNKDMLVFLPVLLFSFTILSNDVPIFSLIADLFYKMPLFGQIFRFTFTKFSILTVFSLSIFYTMGVIGVESFIKNNLLRKTVLLSFFFIPIIFLYPVFLGKLFYEKERVKIPQEYFQVFDFFKKQPIDGRIANFPQYTFWGWSLYRWNSSGSGFLWYGIEQPIIDRAFDVWSREDENFYHEISYALYSRNYMLFEDILEKYQIQWLLVDGNIISFTTGRTLYIDHLEELVSTSNKFVLASQFGKIKIYRVNLKTKPNFFVFLAENLSVVGSGYKWGNYDKAYEEYGNYISDNPSTALRISKQQTTNSQIYYPFRSLFTGRRQEELEFIVKETHLRQDFGGQEGEYYSFLAKIPQEMNGSNLIIPKVEKEEVTEYDENDLSRTTEKYPQILLDGEIIKLPESSEPGNEIISPLSHIDQGNLEVRIPKIKGYYSYNLIPGTYNPDPKNCDQFNSGIINNNLISENGKRLLRLTSTESSNCLDLDLFNLSHRLGYLISLGNRYVEGKSLLFSVINKNSQRADIETYLPKRGLNSIIPGGSPSVSKAYFVIPPMEQFGLGYTLYLDNISIGQVKTVNDLGEIAVNPIPYRFLTALKIVGKNVGYTSSKQSESISSRQARTILSPDKLKVEHPNPSLYQITINNETMKQLNNGSTLVLSQSFDSGWKAYSIDKQQFSNINSLLPFLFGQELKNHMLVNNWENGWRLDNETIEQCNSDQCNIIIVYLPQYLEYIGFILLGIGILYVVFHPKSITPAS